MDKNVKRILWGTGVLVVIAIILTIYSCISGNYDVGEYYVMGVLVACFAFVIIGGTFIFSVGMKKIYDKKKNIDHIVVKKQKPLPVYSIGFKSVYILFCIIVLFVPFITLELFPTFSNVDAFVTACYVCFFLAIILGIFFYIKLRQNKVLYLIKDNDKILEYDDNVSITEELHNMQTLLETEGDFITKKCESIELDNNIFIWSCHSLLITRHIGDKHNTRRHYSFIVASDKYNNTDNNFEIIINNNPFYYINKENQYISKYSNLPPFLISGEGAENICNNIEEICSEFFSKARLHYALSIKDGNITLGLKSARFGGINRIFNKNKTITLTKEAIEEIANFLLRIKNTIDRT